MIVDALNKIADALFSIRDVQKQTLREMKKQTALMSLTLEFTIAESHGDNITNQIAQNIIDTVKEEVTKRAYEKE